ncbi:oligosaccharide flippase family protein [Vibrio sp. IRLE0018]|uniref:lipopolysaccharide biosynthesis protein n=1 Tax=Vibrio floridensis TaxID=2908007 RepID=UPI001EFFEFB5|nr:oligosaccharide flippase family protein [Vibrio floridensis]MCF8780029.1 oligosaccharide flippase family protein [Vibrio floridensis]
MNIKWPSALRAKSVQNISLFGVALLLQKGAALIMLPIMAHHLTAEQMGSLELLASIGTFSALLISFSLHEVLYRFAAQYTTSDGKKQIVNQIYSFALLIASMSLMLCILAVMYLPLPLRALDGAVTRVSLLLLFICVCLECLIAIGTAWLRMQEDKAKTLVKVSVSALVLQLSAVMIVLRFFPAVEAIIACSLISALYQCLALHVIHRYQWMTLSWLQLKSWLHYAAPLMFSGVLAFSLNGAERWFIGGYTSLTQLGIYAIAAKFALAMCILVQPFGMWWMPKRFEYLQSQRYREAAQISQIGLVYIAFLGVIVFALGKVFVLHALPESFSPAIHFLALLIPAAMFKECYELLNLGVLFRQQTALLFKINLLSAVIALSLFALLSPIGVMGICLALALTQAARLSFVSYFSQQALPLVWQHRRLVAVYATALLGIAGQYLLTRQDANANEFASLFLTLITLMVMTWLAYPMLNWSSSSRKTEIQGEIA